MATMQVSYVPQILVLLKTNKFRRFVPLFFFLDSAVQGLPTASERIGLNSFMGVPVCAPVYKTKLALFWDVRGLHIPR